MSESSETQQGLGCLGAMFALLLLTCAGMFLWFQEDPPAHGDEYSAASMAEEFVSEHLQFPDEAEFPREGQKATFAEGDKSWRVAGTVKAKNAFGVTSRHEYVVFLRLTARDRDGTEHWRADKVILDDQTVFLVDD